jgi:hypothetical protein
MSNGPHSGAGIAFCHATDDSDKKKKKRKRFSLPQFMDVNIYIGEKEKEKNCKLKKNFFLVNPHYFVFQSS